MVWRELIKSSDFPGDWYGWTTNQISHFWLGVFFACIGTVVCVLVIGEFPEKLHLLALIGVSYLLFELIFQGWKGWDTIEDWLFVCAYGAGNAILTFTEKTPGDFVADADLRTAAIGFAMAGGHLAVGIAKRLR